MSISVGMSVRFVRSRKIEDEELNQILEKHAKYLREEDGGECADLSYIDLSEKNLSGMDLSEAILVGTNLMKANLSGADLSNACLIKASLTGADLTGATLVNAEMNGADLDHMNAREADFSGAEMIQALMWDCNFEKSKFVLSKLIGSKLCDCNLKGADLRGAELYGCDLDYAHFEGADLEWANLMETKNAYYATFEGANMTHTEVSGLALDKKRVKDAKGLFIPNACPEEGSFIAWKKCRDERIVKLLIPKEAKRVGGDYWDIRASTAEVVEIIGLNGETCTEAVSFFDPEFVYRLGETLTVAEYDEDPYCNGAGIHFVLSREEAERMNLSQFLEEDAN